MLAQIPRKPVFPEHMIANVIRRIERDVQDDVVPVSTGIYSQYKLNERLQAIPKPVIVDYEDRVFYELADYTKFPCKLNNCIQCGEQFGNKKNTPVQCKFCAVWNCSQCICPRKRYHPRAKESNSERYDICYRCDDKFLSLTLHHGYVESKALLDAAISRTKKQKQQVQRQCQQREQNSNYTRESITKNKFKISSIKKQQVDLRKGIIKIQTQTQQEKMRLQIRQKYLTMLMKKKKAIKEIQAKKANSFQQISNIQSNEQTVKQPLQQSIKQQKTKRMLSQTNVISESIKIDRDSLNRSEHQKEPQIDSSPVEETLSSPPQQTVLDFYNYHQWNEEKHKQNIGEAIAQINNIQQLTLENQEGRNSNELQTNVIQKQEYQTQKQQKLAQIFKKSQPVLIHQYEQDEDDTESLQQQVIKMRKAELMRASIEQSHKQRMSMDEQLPSIQRKSCACIIY